MPTAAQSPLREARRQLDLVLLDLATLDEEQPTKPIVELLATAAARSLAVNALCAYHGQRAARETNDALLSLADRLESYLDEAAPPSTNGKAGEVLNIIVDENGVKIPSWGTLTREIAVDVAAAIVVRCNITDDELNAKKQDVVAHDALAAGADPGLIAPAPVDPPAAPTDPAAS